MTRIFNKYGWFILLLLMGLSFAFFRIFYAYHLFFKEQIQLFLFTSDYFLSYFNKPAWLAAYTGDFLTQFFYLTGGGPIVLSLILGLEWFVMFVVLKRITGSPGSALWALFPVGVDWVLHCNTLHRVSFSIGFVLTCCLFLAYFSLRKKSVSYFLLTIFALTGYWLAGSPFFIFPFMIFALWLSKRNIHWLPVIIVFAVVFSLPFVLRHSFLLTSLHALLYPALGKQDMLLPGVAIFSFMALLILKRIENTSFFVVHFSSGILFVLLMFFGLKSTANYSFEKILSLDCENYFGNPEKVIELAEKYKLQNRQATYFTNMALAKKGILPERLLDFYQPFSLGLIMPVTPEENWQSILVSSEVFYLIGDMNMAQHSAMLGNTFSPYQRSARMMRRLAEINMANGDSAAAVKYLRILSRTLFYRQWAVSRLNGLFSSEHGDRKTGNTGQITDADMLRKSTDYLTSLQFMAEQYPDNSTAVDYLLCYLLLNKNLKLFRENYDRFYLNLHRKVPKAYAEALLVRLVASDASPNDVAKYNIDKEIVNRFTEYTGIFDKTLGDLNALSRKFGKSYWFYYHFATMQKK
jgi:hypothetical protein